MVTLSFMPYSEIEGLSSIGRIRKLLNVAKENKIVLLQGRLKKEEEAELIKATMEEINKDFKGIELAVVDQSLNTGRTVDSLPVFWRRGRAVTFSAKNRWAASDWSIHPNWKIYCIEQM